MPDAEARTLEMKSFPWFAARKENYMDGEDALQLWFIDGVHDLPYMDLTSWADLMNLIMTNDGESPGYELKP